MRRLFIGLAVATVAFAAVACSAAGGTGGTLDGTNWKLTSYSASGTSTDVPADVTVTAHFSGTQVGGSGGCNVYSAATTISGAKITIGAPTSTLMMCDGPGGTVETAYFANLVLASTFTAAADTLTIFDSSGKAILVYAAAAANPIEGAWNVTGYNNGNEAVVSPEVGTTLTATFGPDGQVAGSAGCNTYNGAYTLDGTSLTVGPLATTRMACEESIMTQETAFLTALQTPTQVEVSGATVTLRAADGATQVVLAPQ